jgi:hypothetical protein
VDVGETFEGCGDELNTFHLSIIIILTLSFVLVVFLLECTLFDSNSSGLTALLAQHM